MIYETVVPDFNLKKTLESGQIFRYFPQEDGSVKCITGNHVCTASQSGYLFSIKTNESEKYDSDLVAFWRHYFGINIDISRFKALMQENSFLQEVYSYSAGIRIMNQNPWEMLISLIISIQKRIPQIAACVSKLCTVYGNNRIEGINTFPIPERLMNADLSDMGLGYRGPYITQVAYAVFTKQISLERLTPLYVTYEEAITKLQELPGVGPKVANCVALMSLEHTNAFPIDVHIGRILNIPEMQGINLDAFGNYKGLLQQYLFYYALNNGL